jgi:predicted TIM-barrel fold metal-dependent hydrolase
MDALASSGVKNVDGYPTPKWSLQEHLDTMDKNEISTCVVSLSSPGLSFIDGDPRQQLARSINETFADIKAKHPGRFGTFALLTLPDVDSAVDEIAYALDVLKLDGVGLLATMMEYMWAMTALPLSLTS